MKTAGSALANNRRFHVLVGFVLLCVAAFLTTSSSNTSYFDALQAGIKSYASGSQGSAGNHGGSTSISADSEHRLEDEAGHNSKGKAEQGHTIASQSTNATNIDMSTSKTSSDVRKWEKPNGFKVVALVFYGRRAFVDILDCYLRKNLVSAGGYLDEVLFLENTNVAEDQKYLAELVEQVPLYNKVRIDSGGYGEMWSHATDNETMYLKIDDDIVFLSEDAVPEMVHTLLNHPEAHDVAGNLVNSDFTNWLHYHGGAVHPYLPELTAPPPKNASSWRPSELPTYPEDAAPAHFDLPSLWWRPSGGWKVGQKGGPPHENHRWLPLKNEAATLMQTPIEHAEFKWGGNALTSWAIAAQQQYSLFQNIEDGTLDKYHFGTRDGVWNHQYEYYNVNFLAIWGRSINQMRPTDGMDELELSVTFTKALRKPLLIQSKAVVAHFNFGPQPEVKHTDLLSRYRAYANEMVCTSDNQKKEFVF